MTRGAIVLCGGESSRMGRPKLSLPFGPELMLQRVVRLAAQVVDQVVVVAAPDQDVPPLPDEVLLVRDRRQGRGPLEGLSAGLAGLPESVEAAYATSCDAPLLLPAFVERMFEWLGGYDIAVPKDGKYHHPLAAVYRPSVRPEVDRLLAADRLRPFFLFDRVRTRHVPVDDLREVDPGLQSLRNCNQPGDYIIAIGASGYSAPREISTTFDPAEVLTQVGARLEQENGIVVAAYAEESDFNDAAMPFLVRVPDLRTVELIDTSVTCEAISLLRELPSLENLSLCGNGITDASLASLAGCAKLRQLNLWDSEVTDRGIEHLLCHPQLENLSLEGTTVGDEVVVAVAKLPKLRWLDLSGTRVTNKGLERLAACRQLEWLSVKDSPVRVDETGPHPRSSVKRTRVTLDGIHGLRNVLPNCRILGNDRMH